MQDHPTECVPTEKDVLLGRGKLSYRNEGNNRYRAILRKNLHRFQMAHTRLEKTRIVFETIAEIQEGGARFLKCISKEGGPLLNIWTHAKFREIREKVGHALRDATHEKSKRNPPISSNLATKESKTVKCLSNITKRSLDDEPIVDNTHFKHSPVPTANSQLTIEDPFTRIVLPTARDVIAERGGLVIDLRHEGNKRFRAILGKNLHKYWIARSSADTSRIVEEITQEILAGGTRFLEAIPQQNMRTLRVMELGEAREKVRLALTADCEFMIKNTIAPVTMALDPRLARMSGSFVHRQQPVAHAAHDQAWNATVRDLIRFRCGTDSSVAIFIPNNQAVLPESVNSNPPHAVCNSEKQPRA